MSVAESMLFFSTSRVNILKPRRSCTSSSLSGPEEPAKRIPATRTPSAVARRCAKSSPGAQLLTQTTPASSLVRTTPPEPPWQKCTSRVVFQSTASMLAAGCCLQSACSSSGLRFGLSDCLRKLDGEQVGHRRRLRAKSLPHSSQTMRSPTAPALPLLTLALAARMLAVGGFTTRAGGARGGAAPNRPDTMFTRGRAFVCNMACCGGQPTSAVAEAYVFSSHRSTRWAHALSNFCSRPAAMPSCLPTSVASMWHQSCRTPHQSLTMPSNCSRGKPHRLKNSWRQAQ
mmetsp:Transcript_79066/g.228610  ORF Transcript_79066/g.228610 Transcript_79066/m.228610 type:complete len:286 (-) Transcript_79066:134-991(-)